MAPSYKLKREIKTLGGALRNTTWLQAAELIIERRLTNIVETGCYRGNPSDGMSTILLAKIAREVQGHLTSYEINPNHKTAAVNRLKEHSCQNLATVICGDAKQLLLQREETIDFLYLDSMDVRWREGLAHESAMQHHLELTAALPKLSTRSVIMIDDCQLLGAPEELSDGKSMVIHSWLLRLTRYQLVADEYQRIYAL